MSMTETTPLTTKTNTFGNRNLQRRPAVSNPLDIIVLFTLSVFLIRMPPSIRYLSYLFGPETSLSPSVLSGTITGLSTLLILAFFLIAMKVEGSLAKHLKIIIVCLFTMFYMALPTISDMAVRHDLGLRVSDRQLSFAHDGGVLQTEAAIRFLLQGVSPYSADYHGTEMEKGVDSNPSLWNELGFKENPSYYYYSYPPLTVLLSTPFYLVSYMLFDWYDQRLVYLFALVALGIIGYQLPTSPQWRLPLMTLLVLNPLSASDFWLGMNDVLSLTFIMATLLAITRKRHRTSALMLGLACGLKQFSWVLVPFYIIYLYVQFPKDNLPTRLKKLGTYTWPLFITLGLIFVPFLFWDPRGVFHSLITANAVVYPFRSTSLGFTNFLILFKWIEHYRDSFPNVLFYLTIVGPVCVLGLWRIATQKSLSSMVTWYLVTLLLFLFFSRHFAPNYFGLLFAMMAVALVVAQDEIRKDMPDAVAPQESAKNVKNGDCHRR